MPLVKPSRFCPYCAGSGSRHILREQRFYPPGLLGECYNVSICQNCGGAFADNIPTQQELDRYYESESKYELSPSMARESKFDIQRFQIIARQIRSVVDDLSASILDVGCATGGLLATLRSTGFKDLFGVDPSEVCVANAARLHGVHAKRATLGRLRQLGRRFDVVALVGVLEHVADIDMALEDVDAILSLNGVIYCAQPDVESFDKVITAPFQQFSTEHINFFSRKSLERLMRRKGFEPAAVWHWLVEWREGAMDSVVSGCFVRAERNALGEYDDISEAALKHYIERCLEEEPKLRSILDQYRQSKASLIIWGVGTLTRRLLAEDAFAQINIAAFVDSNPHFQGQIVAGRRIVSPMEVSKMPMHPILILSKVFQREIVEQIGSVLHLGNPVLTLD